MSFHFSDFSQDFMDIRPEKFGGYLVKDYDGVYKLQKQIESSLGKTVHILATQEPEIGK